MIAYLLIAVSTPRVQRASCTRLTYTYAHLQVRGQFMGHYLSACAMLANNTGAKSESAAIWDWLAGSVLEHHVD